MNLGIIYKFLCKTTGKFIIGSTILPNKRKNCYYAKLRNNKWNNSYVQDSWNKYGEESFIWEIIHENIPEEILLYLEDIYIGALCAKAEDKKNGMNLIDASRPKLSKESIEKMKLTKSLNKKPCSEETRRKKGLPHLGKKHSKEQIEKSRVARRKPIVQISIDNKFIKHWTSSLEASENLLIPNTSICGCLKNRSETAGGYIWAYLQDFEVGNIKKINIEKIQKREQLKATIKEISELKEYTISTSKLAEKYNVSRSTIIRNIKCKKLLNHKEKL